MTIIFFKMKHRRDSHKSGLAHALGKLKKKGKYIGDLALRPFRTKGGHAEDVERYAAERQAFDDNLVALQKGYVADKTLLSYEKSRVLGAGSFGRVLLVKLKGTEDWSACKIISKKRIIETKQVEHTLNEKNILFCMNSPFVVKLFEFFQDAKNLYFVLEFVSGGEMFTVLQRSRRRKFTAEQTQYFAAQVRVCYRFMFFFLLFFPLLFFPRSTSGSYNVRTVNSSKHRFVDHFEPRLVSSAGLNDTIV